MIFLEILKPHGIDYRVYWESAWMLLHGLNPYHGIISSDFPLNYPPPVFFLIWPLGLLTSLQAAPIWNITSTISVVLSVYLVLKMGLSKIPLKLFITLSLLFTIFFFPVKFNIGNGQINHFILLFCSLSLYLYRVNKKNLSALFLAFAISIKLAPLIFLLYFVITKDWRQILKVLVLTVLIFIAPILLLGWNYQQRYYQEIFFYSFTNGAKDWYYNQSLSGFLARHLPNMNYLMPIFYSLGLIVVFTTYKIGKKLNWLRSLSAVSILYLLIHPIALQHYFGFALIPLILLGIDFYKNGAKKIHWIALLVAYFLFAKDIRGFETIPKNLSIVLSHMFFGSITVWLLALFKEKFETMIFIAFSSIVLFLYISTLVCKVVC